ncbi:hypothetical protein D1605_009915 [Xylella fastidiosa subsp. fastidiosa]|uniref:Uncharacterized protein n=2 Tax=Xylella fastidiosa TaxID=2371 RepID=Q87AH3_XYLFT|nr:hypothetical protein [Xylella fastidiosa]KAF0571164.1 hypothetical protein P305_06045 [Xylella fastidiosa subsp. fastidiosa Mus-1]AAO29684.1 conserved hypothetical protein [Xylella fastidiosa Temecula1]ACB93353.1 hypothetical protein XfasM23_1954 [Xylella fastidiosa M23]EGO81384.1 hypothetical protein XFEB_01890 [Xylella fastidiosa EB92.1]KGM19625.1 hypothetical protein JT24_10345 [Xylella fastidiosa]
MTGCADKTLLWCHVAVGTSGGATAQLCSHTAIARRIDINHEMLDAHRDAVWLFQYEEVRIAIQACIIRLYPRDGY